MLNETTVINDKLNKPINNKLLKKKERENLRQYAKNLQELFDYTSKNKNFTVKLIEENKKEIFSEYDIRREILQKIQEIEGVIYGSKRLSAKEMAKHTACVRGLFALLDRTHLGPEKLREKKDQILADPTKVDSILFFKKIVPQNKAQLRVHHPRNHSQLHRSNSNKTY